MTNDQYGQTVPALLFDARARQMWSPDTSPQSSAAAGMPLPSIIAPRGEGSIWMTTTTLDRDGRIAIRSATNHLGWPTGKRTTVDADPPSGQLTLTLDGTTPVSVLGLVRLPAPIRRSCNLSTGDRLLLVADASTGVLFAFTAYAIGRLWLPTDAVEPTGGGA